MSMPSNHPPSESGGETFQSGTSPARPASAPHHDHSGGLFHHLWAWLEAMLHCLQLRSQLALIEAKEAGSHYGVIAGLVIGALILALFAYVFLVLTIVFALAAWMDGSYVWLKIMGGATGVHLLLAAVLALVAKTRLKAGVFEKTKAEFRKDKSWPKTPTHPSQPTN
ncbi:MAG: phage holin family protein [Verrucomicrobia bacterium]|nr:phage holin family protein [Verrucomicrobiota bacterium]